MPDIYEINKASKITWIKRIANNEDAKWKHLMCKLLDINEQLFLYKLPLVYSQRCKTKFHKQVMESWLSIKNTNPTSCNEILNEYVFHSTLVASGNEELNYQKFGVFYTKNKLIKLIDIFDKTS